MPKRGVLVVISAPSGGGKTTLLRRVRAEGSGCFEYSISATTRTRRRNEVDGRDYFFLNMDEFERRKKNGEFVEWAEVHGYHYGTPAEPIERWLDQGKVILADLDVDGGLAVKARFGESALLIFVRPPSFVSLFERLKKRNTETDSEIEKRLQRYPKEMKKSKYYDVQVVNENLDETAAKVLKLINNYNYCND